MTRGGRRPRAGAGVDSQSAGDAAAADAITTEDDRRAVVDEPATAAVAPDGVDERDAAANDADGMLDPAVLATARRMARLHLRMGLLVLARAELEALAGRFSLDDDALTDLAEARWRTGDLAGAGVTAGLLVERGSASPTVLAIAAEAVAAEGRPGEARRLATRALDAADQPLTALFAGMPRHAIWPDGADGASTPAAVDLPGEATAAADLAVDPAEMPHAGLIPSGGRPSSERIPPPGAAEAYAGGRAALAAGDLHRAALRLGVALRLDPAFAAQVLDAIDDRASEPELALLAGDALRILGREREALAAFDIARGGVPDAAPLEAPAADGDRDAGDAST